MRTRLLTFLGWPSTLALFLTGAVNSNGDLVGLASSDWAVQVTAAVSSTPAQIQLNWVGDPSAQTYKVSRKPRDASTWQEIAVLPPTQSAFVDTNISVGTGYEYRIVKETDKRLFDFSTEGYKAYGYIYSGVQLPLVENRGKVILLVENSVADALQNELDRLEFDLIADGWGVVRETVSRSDSVTAVKARIQSIYAADPVNTRSLLLLGNIPVPYSGDITPDEHPNHKGAWPADVYYGDIDGTWTDSAVSDVRAERPGNRNTPGDGKFDQNGPPSSVELQVGRVDLSNLTCFANKTPSRNETDLLRRYLDKNHRFRNALLEINPAAMVYDVIGTSQPLPEPMAAFVWRNLTPLVGDKITSIGDSQYHALAAQSSYLWSMVCSWGSYDNCTYVGTADDFAAGSAVNVVFTTFIGSYFGDWDNESAYLRAALGASGTLLTTCYAGKPQWLFHHMAMGETIGYSTRVTQENGPNGPYLPHAPGSGEVHISLLGDPTLRERPLKQVSNLQATRDDAGLHLSWDASNVPGLQGYLVYKSTNRKGPYQSIGGLSAATSVLVPNALPTDFFLVKVVALTETPSGSYFNNSPGTYFPDPLAAVLPPGAVPKTVRTPAGEPIAITLAGNGGTPGSVLSFQVVDLPLKGQLSGTPPHLTYVPPSGVSGFDYFTYAASDGTTQSSPAVVTVEILHTNHPPNALNRTVYAPTTGTVTIDLSGNDLDGDPLAFQLISQPSRGQISGIPPKLTYTPFIASLADDSFNYIVSDGLIQSEPATVTIRIGRANQPPIATAATFQMVANVPLNIALSGTDGDGDTLAYQITSPPEKGVISGNPPNVIYTPGSDASGNDSFAFTVSDGSAESAPSHVRIDFITPNRAPSATSLTVEGAENTTLPIELSGTDPDGDSLSFQISNPPSKGQLSGNPPNVTYTPAANTFGPDSFAFLVSDGAVQSAPATVTIQITHRNLAPIANADDVVRFQSQIIFPSMLLTANDSDPDGDGLTILAVQSPTVNGGSVSLSNGEVTYQAAPQGASDDQFEYTIGDSSGATATATVRVIFTFSKLDLENVSQEVIRLRISGAPKSAYHILSSSDALEWTSISQGVSDESGQAELVLNRRDVQVELYKVEWP
jgi:hypothetical protein